MAKRKTEGQVRAEAWKRWIESDEGKETGTAYDFTQPGYWQYLENRLHHAFMAGCEAMKPAKSPKRKAVQRGTN